MTKVTVVVAAFNAEATIAETLNSIQGQTFEDWEAIIVDDASSDGTIEAVRPFLADARFRLIVNANNTGAGRSRNIAISEARAELIAVLDADDVARPERLERQVAAFEADPDLTVLGGQLAEFGSWGGPEVTSYAIDPSEIADKINSGKMPVAHCAVMMRKAKVLAVGGYDEDCKRAEDFLLLRKLVGNKFAALPDVLVDYRTVRPLPLAYAISSGRYGRMARVRTHPANPRPVAVQKFPASALTDARSVITWARRRLRERGAGSR